LRQFRLTAPWFAEESPGCMPRGTPCSSRRNCKGFSTFFEIENLQGKEYRMRGSKMTKLFLLFFLLSLWASERERREGRGYFVPLKQCFSTYSSRGTFKPLLNVWRNLDTWNRADFRIPREPSKEFAEPRLKNTALKACYVFLKCLPEKKRLHQAWMKFDLSFFTTRFENDLSIFQNSLVRLNNF